MMERTRRNQVVQFPRTLSEMYPVKNGKACDLAPVFKALKPGLHKRIIIDEPLGTPFNVFERIQLVFRAWAEPSQR
uniref:SFRICE_041097 n=1 Tax=Spodoptera frugiperda TaxID=7108 RepID=A0A2H1WZ93_SPOFR